MEATNSLPNPLPPSSPVDLTLVSAHDLTLELSRRFDIMVFIGKKMNVDNKIGTITWDRYQGDSNIVAGLALEASIKAIYGKLSTAFPVQDF